MAVSSMILWLLPILSTAICVRALLPDATVETQGISIGQTLVDTYHFWNKPDNSYILTQTDAYGFMKFFLQRVINAPESEIERILKTI